jgi:uncharacterized protein (TIGR03000 family)
MTALTSGPGFGSDSEVPAIVSEMGNPIYPGSIGNYGCYACTGCTGCTGCSGCFGSCHGGLLFHRFQGMFSHKHPFSCFSGMGYPGNTGVGWASHSSVFVAPAAWITCNPYIGQFGWSGASCLGTFSSGCHGGCTGLVSVWGPPTGMQLYTLYALPWSASIAETKSVNILASPPKPVIPESKIGGQGQVPAAAATVKITLPQGASLYVDGVLTKQVGAERSFTTPPLSSGDRYCYDVRAELLTNGKLEVEERQIIVVAGATVVESFPKLLAITDRVGNPIATK